MNVKKLTKNLYEISFDQENSTIKTTVFNDGIFIQQIEGEDLSIVEIEKENVVPFLKAITESFLKAFK